MKQPSAETDIRKAVKEYVDQLIQERSAAGRGMAVSAGDLMTAARTAGEKVSINTDVTTFLRPGLNYVQTSMGQNERVTKRDGRGTRTTMPNRGYKPPPKPQREPHWMSWKTGNTPVPQHFVNPRPPSSVARPRTGASFVSRGATPAAVELCESPDIEQIVHDQQVADVALPMTPAIPPTPSMTVAPRPPSITHRYTPGPADVRQTPQVLHVDNGKTSHDTQRPTSTISTKQKLPSNPAYMPALKAWVSDANEYERDVAHSLLQVLSTNACLPEYKAKPRPKSVGPSTLGRMAAGTRRNIPRTAGVVTSNPAAWQQAYSDPYRDRPQAINDMTKCLERQELQKYYRHVQGPKNPRFQPRSQDFIHEASCFMNSHQPYRSSFTINPEWVSEFKTFKKPPHFRNNKTCAVRY